jgi:diadenosine tetraphosphatase ApaH/serine/threonine PP2A family protein phosphatase
VLALLYDVHGNLPALEAVLSDARAQGATQWVLGGDYALFGGWPAETVDRLHTLDHAVWIRGNGERWTAHPQDAPVDRVVPGAVEAARAALGAARVRELGLLPESIEHDGTLFCHASPISDVRSFLPEAADDEDELLAPVVASRLVFGHTHLQFRRMRERHPIEGHGLELVNPGSVGMPFDGDPRAAYALVHPGRRVELRRVAYDHRASAARVRDAFGGAPWTDVVARRIERAAFDV